ncbi:MAG TPA: hypothetical protein VGV38_19845 [Pyrinomonadaceae bacterium]|nr:hypothetical protein [Pyrinomonadaceae bacterium]
MRTSFIALGLAALLLVAALAAFAFGPQFEVRNLPADLQAIYLSADLRRKWNMIAALLGVVAALVALLAGVLWVNERKRTE